MKRLLTIIQWSMGVAGLLLGASDSERQHYLNSF